VAVRLHRFVAGRSLLFPFSRLASLPVTNPVVVAAKTETALKVAASLLIIPASELKSSRPQFIRLRLRLFTYF
jgi:hypothetical protein